MDPKIQRNYLPCPYISLDVIVNLGKGLLTGWELPHRITYHNFPVKHPILGLNAPNRNAVTKLVPTNLAYHISCVTNFHGKGISPFHLQQNEEIILPGL